MTYYLRSREVVAYYNSDHIRAEFRAIQHAYAADEQPSGPDGVELVALTICGHEFSASEVSDLPAPVRKALDALADECEWEDA